MATNNQLQTSLFVKGLGKGVNETNLYSLFFPFGLILEAKIAKHRSGRSAGFAIVTFSTFQEALTAMTRVDETYYQGKKLSVRWFRPELELQHASMPGLSYESFTGSSVSCFNSDVGHQTSSPSFVTDDIGATPLNAPSSFWFSQVNEWLKDYNQQEAEMAFIPQELNSSECSLSSEMTDVWAKITVEGIHNESKGAIKTGMWPSLSSELKSLEENDHISDLSAVRDCGITSCHADVQKPAKQCHAKPVLDQDKKVDSITNAISNLRLPPNTSSADCIAKSLRYVKDATQSDVRKNIDKRTAARMPQWTQPLVHSQAIHSNPSASFSACNQPFASGLDAVFASQESSGVAGHTTRQVPQAHPNLTLQHSLQAAFVNQQLNTAQQQYAEALAHLVLVQNQMLQSAFAQPSVAACNLLQHSTLPISIAHGNQASNAGSLFERMGRMFL